MTTEKLHDPMLVSAFNLFEDKLRPHLLTLRQLIFATAATIPDCGEVIESLKWGQPSYATVNPKSGTPIRLGAPKSSPGCYALFMPCQTTLIETIREIYHDDFQYEGNRALILRADTTYSNDNISHCMAMALMYYARQSASKSIGKKRPAPLK
ncbi:MAG: DUF1801 domain-containing protein [bacterium]|nr:DUF1801 domain-containing protein [bacterium]